MELPTTIEHFFGVYILCNQSDDKRFSGRCYIGYTVNPNRRIKQHNRGKDFGGARKTSNKGPWRMVLIVHGFQNNISALQFEWAWQNPKVSVRLKHNPNITSKRRNETNFQYNFRILTEMLGTGPWNRLPLTIRWLDPEFQILFPPLNFPPSHMKICSGLVNVKKKSKRNNKHIETDKDFEKRKYECHLCMNLIDNVARSKLVCVNAKCKFISHVICLAKLWLVDGNNCGQYVPIEGDCPLCETHCLWGDLIQKKNCSDVKDNANVTDEDTENDESDDEEEYNGEHDLDVISLSSHCDSTEE